MTFEFDKNLPQEVISQKVVFDGLETSEKGTGMVRQTSSILDIYRKVISIL